VENSILHPSQNGYHEEKCILAKLRTINYETNSTKIALMRTHPMILDINQWGKKLDKLDTLKYAGKMENT